MPVLYALAMRTRRLGSSDLEVTVVGLGCNNFGGRIDEKASRAVIDAALEVGVTFFDTADVYGNRGGSEEIIGRALAGRRDQVVLATKFGHDLGDGETARGARPYIRKAIEASLRRLQTDWIDLYQYHRPDGVTPIEETLGALHELVQEGTVRAIGSSNFTAAMVEEAHSVARQRELTPFASEQSEYSWLARAAEDELLPTCERLGIGFIPYFPLASGLLTGKYRRGEPAPEGTRLHGRELDDAKLDRVERLEAFASERGVTLLEVAIGGLLAQPAVASVIAGATKPEQVRANSRAGNWQPSAEELAALRPL
jgi:aryl-alcohol dehydrogenase-like predicted oxidoreductase